MVLWRIERLRSFYSCNIVFTSWITFLGSIKHTQSALTVNINRRKRLISRKGTSVGIYIFISYDISDDRKFRLLLRLLFSIVYKSRRKSFREANFSSSVQQVIFHGKIHKRTDFKYLFFPSTCYSNVNFSELSQHWWQKQEGIVTSIIARVLEIESDRKNGVQTNARARTYATV